MNFKRTLNNCLIVISSLILVSTFLILAIQYLRSASIVPKIIELQQLSLFYEEYPNIFLSRVTKSLFVAQNLYEVNFNAVLLVIVSVISSLSIYEILAFVAYLVLVFYSIFDENKTHKKRLKKIDFLFSVFVIMNLVIAFLAFYSIYYMELDVYVALEYGKYIIWIGSGLMLVSIFIMYVFNPLYRLLTKFRESYE